MHFEATEAVSLWEQLHLIILTTTAANTHSELIFMLTCIRLSNIPESLSVVQNRGRAYTRHLFEGLRNFVNIAESMEQSHLSYVVVLC